MFIAIPDDLTVGHFETGWNTKLSSEDINFAKEIYPRGNEKVHARFTITNRTTKTVHFALFGDGKRHSLKPGQDGRYEASRMGAAPYAMIEQPELSVHIHPLGEVIHVPQPWHREKLFDRNYELVKKGEKYELQ